MFQFDDIEQPEQFPSEEPELQSFEEATALLRSCWKFAAVIQFSRMFAAPLRLKVFAADILESALINPDNHRMFLSELLFKLLRADALQPYSEKDSEGWESLLYRKVSAKWPEHFESHPLLGTTFYDITPTKRVCRCRLGCFQVAALNRQSLCAWFLCRWTSCLHSVTGGCTTAQL